MAALTKQEIEQLKQQLAEKEREIKEIHNQLIEAGAWPIDDDILDTVSGGTRSTNYSLVDPPVFRTDHSFR